MNCLEKQTSGIVQTIYDRKDEFTCTNATNACKEYSRTNKSNENEMGIYQVNKTASETRQEKERPIL